MKRLIFTGEIWKEGDMYTSYCLELDLASCGETIKQRKICWKSSKSSLKRLPNWVRYESYWKKQVIILMDRMFYNKPGNQSLSSRWNFKWEQYDMPRITPIDWQTQVKIFEKFGCQFVREKGDCHKFPTLV